MWESFPLNFNLVWSRLEMEYLGWSAVAHCGVTCGVLIKLQILLLSGDAEGAASVAMVAAQRYSQSVSMWSLSLQTLMQLGSGEVGRLFQEALTHINPKVRRAHTHFDST